MPYTDKEDIANKYKIPTLILEITQPSAIGITAQAAIESENATIGAKRKTILFETVGNMVSFEKSFSPSARGCKSPNGPTTLGPFLN